MKAETQNRATRRKVAAFQKSAKWKRLYNNAHKAAVRKLNKLAEEARTRASMPDPED